MLPNKAKFNYDDLADIFGEKSLRNFSSGFSCEGVSTDTREIVPGNLFIALSGENTDGHSRIEEAFEKGASAAVCREEWHDASSQGFSGKAFIVVKNTLAALGKLATFHRRRFDYPVVAIGGANGKTTTKDMAAHILSQKFRVLKTYKNFNNQVGVPLMLLQMNDDYEVAVLEAGTNEPGEIALLSAIIEPTHGIITNIGREHLEKLIDLDGVEMEETFLFGWLNKRGGISFINLDDERLRRYSAIIENKVCYGSKKNSPAEGSSESGFENIFNGVNPDVGAEISLNGELNPEITLVFEGRTISINLKTTGYASALNALAASSIAFVLGLSDDEIIRGAESFEPESGNEYGRMLLEHVGGVKIINDCYNANPDSMSAALKSLKSIKTTGRKIALLADMLELGEASREEHKQIIELSAASADLIFVVGNEMTKAFNELDKSILSNIILFENKELMKAQALEAIKPGDAILIKGSRGMKMEFFANEIKNQYS